ncbi:MAG: DMT family transporter [Pseudomonadota bacterium]
MSPQSKSMNANEWSLLVFLSILWGGAFFAAGVAVKEVPPLTVVLARVGLAAIVLLPVFWYYGFKLPRSLKEWVPFMGMGILNNILPFGFFFAGQTYISVGLASIINAMTPLFTVLVLASFREETLTPSRLVGVLLGAIGVGVIQSDGSTLEWTQTIGVILCLCGAGSYGFAALWGRRFLSGVPPVKSATCQLLSSTVFMLVIVSIIDRPWTLDTPSHSTIWAMVALAVFGTALAYIVFFEILVRAGASNVMLVTLLIPVSAVMLGALFLDEAVLATQVIGALIIGLGLLFIDGRTFKFKKSTH